MSQEVQPLDFQELLACLVRQSGPFLDHLGVKKGNLFLSFSVGFILSGLMIFVTYNLG